MVSQALIDETRENQDPNATERRFDAHDVLALLHRRRRYLMGGTLGAAVLAAAVVLLIPSRYTAETVLLPPAQNDSMTSAFLGQLGGSGMLASMAGTGLGLKSSGDMYIALLRARTVEDAMIRRFGLMARYRAARMSDARKAFESRSMVVFAPKTGLITVQVTDGDARLAAQMANGYTEEFRKFSASLAITEASQRR